MRQFKITKSITNRESASFERYLQDIGKEELISAEEEVRLAVCIRNGDQKALEKLVRANLRFVVSVAKQYQNQGLSLPDLINEGNFGLIKAAKRFDETRGFKFISYAVWWIRQSIMQAIAEQARIVKIPQNRIGAMNKISNASMKIEQKYEREPTLEELKELTNLSNSEIASAIILLFHNSVSLDKPTIDGEETTLLDILQNDTEAPAEYNLVNASRRTDINRALKKLTEREAEVLRYFFGLNEYPPMTLDEIGEKIKLTPERVRQIKEKAVRRLRSSCIRSMLKAHL